MRPAMIIFATVILTFASLAHGKPPTKQSVVTIGYQPSTCSDGCRDALRLVTFTDISPTQGFYAGQCSSSLLVSSLAACSQAYCTRKEAQDGWEAFENICQQYGGVDLLPYDRAIALISANIVEVNTLLQGQGLWSEPILVSREAFTAGLRTEVSRASKQGEGWIGVVLIR